jgi:hypothetical protein
MSMCPKHVESITLHSWSHLVGPLPFTIQKSTKSFAIQLVISQQLGMFYVKCQARHRGRELEVILLSVFLDVTR